MGTDNFRPTLFAAVEGQSSATATGGPFAPPAAVADAEVSLPDGGAAEVRRWAYLTRCAMIARAAEARRVADEQSVVEARARRDWSGAILRYGGANRSTVDVVRAWVDGRRGFRVVRRAADGAVVGFEELVPRDGAELMSALDRAFAALREGGKA